MKRLLALFPLFMLVSCRETVQPGHVGIIVNLYGDSKGVNEKAVGVGRYWIGFNEELYTFPTFSKTYSWTGDDKEGSPNDESLNFQDKEGLFINTDVGITWAIVPEDAVKVFQKFRKGVDEINDTFLRNTVRTALVTEGAKYSIEEIMGAKKEELMQGVEARSKSEAKTVGISIEKVFFLGRFKLPDAVKAALDEKVKATQKAMQIENEVRQVKAEAEKQLVTAESAATVRITQAKAEAESNLLLAKSITPELIRMRELEIKMRAVEKWGGLLPQTMVPNQTVPFVDIEGARK